MTYLYREKSSGVFYFRYQIPIHHRFIFNGRSVIKRSLKTYDRNVAKLEALRLELEIREKMANDSDMMMHASLYFQRTLVFTSVKNYLDLDKTPKVFKMFMSATERIAEKLGVTEDSRSDFEEMILNHVDFNDSRLCAIYNPANGTPAEQAQKFFDYSKSLREELTFSQKIQLKSQLTKLFHIAKSVREVIEQGDNSKALRLLDELDLYLKGEYNAERLAQGRTIESKADTPLLTKSVLLKKIVDGYRLEQQNKGIEDKTINATIHGCLTVHELINKTDMLTVTREDANNALSLVKQYPQNVNQQRYRKHFSGLTADKILDKNKNLGLPIISEGTATRYIERASIVYRWAVRQNYISYNPWEGLASRKKKANKKQVDNRSPFSVDDLKHIFSHKVFTTATVGIGSRNHLPLNYQYWVPLIALHTGMRPNEICQLLKSDVKQINGIWCFDIQVTTDDQKLKNLNSVRVVPIHSKLIELGFLKFLETVTDGERIFNELNYTKSDGYVKSVTNWFKRNIFLEQWKDEKKVFYSFRHTFADFYKQKQLSPQIAGSILGHESGTITYDTYGGNISVEKLKENIEILDFSEVLTRVKPF
jgi:integrase